MKADFKEAIHSAALFTNRIKNQEIVYTPSGRYVSTGKRVELTVADLEAGISVPSSDI